MQLSFMRCVECDLRKMEPASPICSAKAWDELRDHAGLLAAGIAVGPRFSPLPSRNEEDEASNSPAFETDFGKYGNEKGFRGTI